MIMLFPDVFNFGQEDYQIGIENEWIGSLAAAFNDYPHRQYGDLCPCNYSRFPNWRATAISSNYYILISDFRYRFSVLFRIGAFVLPSRPNCL